MSRTDYRLEPLVLLSERGRRTALRRLVAATRELSRLRSEVRAIARREAAAASQARDVLDTSSIDAPPVRIAAELRVEALLAAALWASQEAERAKRTLDEAAMRRRDLVEQGGLAVRDAETQKSARARAVSNALAQARRQRERCEDEMSLEAWTSTRRSIAEEDGHAR